MSRTLALVAPALLALLAAGCSSTPAPTRYYLLTDPSPELEQSSRTAPQALRLGALQLPAYLQSRNIAVVMGNTEVRGARGHRWATPLADAVRRYLEQALATDLQDRLTPAGLLDVQIHHLHGSDAGTVYLQADWQLRDEGSDTAVTAGRFVESVQQGSQGFEALVLAHRALLDQFVAAVAGAAGGLAHQKQAAPTSEAAAIKEKPSS